ncbi:MerR family transcriptional regulator [Ktedonospora formicarum]|uniref:MerR family transcriptional regulator n=1 Tax=Ktedonospora formicarum TaxID=2778364 RepID=A0A8J3I9X2_9CHLR|nr:MerR family transcriptional regulator [Ktedonospora formicarum]GHO48184.1 MerR family transcriptional regulator [Ktedonospora formicarum]
MLEKPQNIEGGLTIQQMAELTGLTPHTLRYYERAGLMQIQVGRDDANGYRLYTQEHVNWIHFIKCLRATGMPIRDIKRYTMLLHQGEQTMPERMALLKQHQDRIEEHLRETERYSTAIRAKIDLYERRMADVEHGEYGIVGGGSAGEHGAV